MPPFSQSVQDLIRRMLTVDAAKRITMDGIIAHPAFRIGLMPEYVCPSPIPFAKFGKSIDTLSIPQEIIDIVNQIGISDKELSDDLQSTENNMSKIFITMLTNRYCDLEALPWECARSGVAKPIRSDEQFGQQLGAFPEGGDIGGNPFGQRTKEHARTPSMSLDTFSYSLVTQASWAIGDVLTVNELICEKTHDLYGTNVWSIFGNVQLLIGEMQYQYFHPDPLTMYIRSYDAAFYMTVQAEYTAISDVKVKFLLHKGETDDFDRLTSKMIDAISK